MQIKTLVVLGTVASACAFVPEAKPHASFALNGIFEQVAGLDLFAPNPDVNTYGARSKKKIVTGKITEGKSYVPAGLTASQYSKFRAGEVKKKADNYAKNVKKAGIFEDYTDFYLKRGTDNSESWAKSVTKGHRMAKTKYDWSGSNDNAAQVGLAASAKKNAAKKKKNIFGL